MTPIELNTIDFVEMTDNYWFDLHYKGKPFTGFLKYDNSIVEYKNGYAHGRLLGYFDDGSIRVDGFCEKGEYVGGREWYQNGQIKIDRNKIYTKNGLLVKDGQSWLYENGQPKEVRLENSTQFFSSEDDLAFEIDYRHSGDYKNIITYYNQIMIKYCTELIANPYPEELNYLRNSIDYYFYGWLASLLLTDAEQGKKILGLFMHHKDESVSRGFTYFHENYPKWNLFEYINKLSYHVILK